MPLNDVAVRSAKPRHSSRDTAETCPGELRPRPAPRPGTARARAWPASGSAIPPCLSPSPLRPSSSERAQAGTRLPQRRPDLRPPRPRANPAARVRVRSSDVRPGDRLPTQWQRVSGLSCAETARIVRGRSLRPRGHQTWIRSLSGEARTARFRAAWRHQVD